MGGSAGGGQHARLMGMKLAAVVEGRPVPKGGLLRGRGRALFYPANVKAYERLVRTKLADEMRKAGLPLFEGATRVNLRFYLGATKAGKLRADLDKLCRLVLDACTGPVWDDDVWVVGLLATKHPVEANGVERVEITVVLDA